MARAECWVMEENSPTSPTEGHPDVARGRTDPDGNCRPIILDPADPTGNLGHNARWDLLAEEAVACMSALCCMGRDGTPIQPWPAKVRELYDAAGRTLPWGQCAQGRGLTPAKGAPVLPRPGCPLVSASPGRLGQTNFFCHLPPGCRVKAGICTRWRDGHQPLAWRDFGSPTRCVCACVCVLVRDRETSIQ